MGAARSANSHVTYFVRPSPAVLSCLAMGLAIRATIQLTHITGFLRPLNAVIIITCGIADPWAVLYRQLPILRITVRKSLRGKIVFTHVWYLLIL